MSNDETEYFNLLDKYEHITSAAILSYQRRYYGSFDRDDLDQEVRTHIWANLYHFVNYAQHTDAEHLIRKSVIRALDIYTNKEITAAYPDFTAYTNKDIDRILAIIFNDTTRATIKSTWNTEEIQDNTPPSQRGNINAVCADVLRGFETLDETKQDIIRAIYTNPELTSTQLAEKLGISDTVLRNQKSRSLAKIRAYISNPKASSRRRPTAA